MRWKNVQKAYYDSFDQYNKSANIIVVIEVKNLQLRRKADRGEDEEKICVRTYIQRNTSDFSTFSFHLNSLPNPTPLHLLPQCSRPKFSQRLQKERIREKERSCPKKKHGEKLFPKFQRCAMSSLETVDCRFFRALYFSIILYASSLVAHF